MTSWLNSEIRRRDWWLGILAVILAVLVHALLPRYQFREVRGVPVLRIDRWTGAAVLGEFAGGRWRPLAPAPRAGAFGPDDVIR